MFLVAGASGNVGSEVVGALLHAGEPVRALVRSIEHELPDGTEAAVGDLNDPASLRAALDGVCGVFLLAGYADMPGLLAEVAGARARRVVLLSGGGAGASDLDNAISRYQLESERVVRESGVPSGMPLEYVDAFLRFYAGGAIDESQPLATVEQVTGNAPASFDEWVARHVGLFR